MLLGELVSSRMELREAVEEVVVPQRSLAATDSVVVEKGRFGAPMPPSFPGSYFLIKRLLKNNSEVSRSGISIESLAGVGFCHGRLPKK